MCVCVVGGGGGGGTSGLKLQVSDGLFIKQFLYSAGSSYAPIMMVILIIGEDDSGELTDVLYQLYSGP